MKNLYLILLLVFGFSVIQAQNGVFFGFSYGTSDVFRKDDSSHYNYTNKEYGIFILKEFAWKSNQENRINKFWFVQPQVNYGKYKFLADEVQQDIFKANVGGGIKFTKKINKTSLHSKLSLNAGYQSGYYQRLEKGVFFTEKLSLGLQFPLNPLLTTFIDIGAMHVSNANAHRLNRGLEVFFVEFGIQIPEKKIVKY